jgi:hypothetical protein
MVRSSHEVVLESVEGTLMCDEASGCCKVGKGPNLVGFGPTPDEEHRCSPGEKTPPNQGFKWITLGLLIECVVNRPVVARFIAGGLY